MHQLNIRRGSLFESPCQTLVNPVNTVGVMGAGLAARFKTRYPEMFLDYQAACRSGALVVGTLHLFRLSGHWVLNFPTKRHFREPARIEVIQTGLTVFKQHYQAWGITSAALPALGCGLGGLSWDLVRPLMVQAQATIEIPVEIYEPA